MWEQARWEHWAVPTGEGSTFLHVEGLYGVANAALDDLKASTNEVLIQRTLGHAESLGEVPVLICADCNMNPAASKTSKPLMSFIFLEVPALWVSFGIAETGTV